MTGTVATGARRGGRSTTGTDGTGAGRTGGSGAETIGAGATRAGGSGTVTVGGGTGRGGGSGAGRRRAAVAGESGYSTGVTGITNGFLSATDTGGSGSGVGGRGGSGGSGWANRRVVGAGATAGGSIRQLGTPGCDTGAAAGGTLGGGGNNRSPGSPFWAGDRKGEHPLKEGIELVELLPSQVVRAWGRRHGHPSGAGPASCRRSRFRRSIRNLRW